MKTSSIIIVLSLFLRACSQQAPDTDNTTPATYPPGDQTYTPSAVRKVLDRQQKAAFTYFYEGAEPQSGMALEGNNRGNTVTIGGSGFGVMALVTGMERGWITRQEGIARMQKILGFLEKADRYKGVWSHWHNPDGSYVAFGDQKAAGDLVETSFLIQGLIVAREYLNGSSSEEKNIRDRIDHLYDTVDWAAFTGPSHDGLYWIWYSIEDRYSLKVTGWNEALCTYLLALGSPEHGITSDIYKKGWSTTAYPSRKTYGYPLPLGRQEKGGPLFFSHYSFLGFDPRHMADDQVWYWQQNLSHALINRHYCLYEAPAGNGYGVGLWGLTACYGAGSSGSYSARSPHNDDGVIAPTAALSSFPYTPFYSAQVLLTLDQLEECKGAYGFADSYKPSEKVATRNHLAIDQGPLVIMIENYRSGLIWKLFMKNERVKRALELAGISEPELTEGFPYLAADNHSGVVDLMVHPDREKYELDCYSSMAGAARLTVTLNTTQEVIKEQDVAVSAGITSISFDDTRITRGKKYIISLRLPSGKTCRFDTILH